MRARRREDEGADSTNRLAAVTIPRPDERGAVRRIRSAIGSQGMEKLGTVTLNGAPVPYDDPGRGSGVRDAEVDPRRAPFHTVSLWRRRGAHSKIEPSFRGRSQLF